MRQLTGDSSINMWDNGKLHLTNIKNKDIHEKYCIDFRIIHDREAPSY